MTLKKSLYRGWTLESLILLFSGAKPRSLMLFSWTWLIVCFTMILEWRPVEVRLEPCLSLQLVKRGRQAVCQFFIPGLSSGLLLINYWIYLAQGMISKIQGKKKTFPFTAACEGSCEVDRWSQENKWDSANLHRDLTSIWPATLGWKKKKKIKRKGKKGAINIPSRGL